MSVGTLPADIWISSRWPPTRVASHPIKYRLVSYLVVKCCLQHFLLALAAEGQAIYVTSASYGRTNKKTCSAGRPADQLENTECYTYREEVGERCNGKQWCKVRASNYVFGNPCYGTYKYLEVEYICYVADIWCGKITGFTGCSGTLMHSDSQHFPFCLPTESGYISVISATYGRRDHTTCSEGIPEEQTRKTDCAMSHQVTISRELIHRCDGESECPFFASSSVLGDPCVGTFKYLEVKYVCKSEFMV
uniref:SUEL-type lectin domain-containing protein n=1 Tax=Poecilia mexicana TaxID=48701 RepID=A0A3B3WN17_9TELE